MTLEGRVAPVAGSTSGIVRGLAAAGADIVPNGFGDAGIQAAHPREAFPGEGWDQVLAVDLSGVFHVMRAKGWERVVNIASARGLVALMHKAADVAARRQTTRRAEEAGTGTEAATRGLLAEKQPMLRSSTPAHMAAAAPYLCPAETVTGRHLSVDGGWTAQ